MIHSLILSDRRNNQYKTLGILIFIIYPILFSFWQIRFFLKFSRIDVLFTSSSVQLIDFHYTDKWVSKRHITDMNKDCKYYKEKSFLSIFH